MFTAASFTIVKTWKQPKCPSIGEYTHPHKILLGHEKNEMLPFVATWMDLEGIMLSEKSQTKKDKHCMTSLICRI